MAIIGTHALLYTSEPDKLRAVLRDGFDFKCVDAGHGWLIFSLPPAELGVHPAEEPMQAASARHQLTFMCDDIRKTSADLIAKGIVVKGEPKDQGWGITVMLELPGGVDLMLYEPLHPVAITRLAPVCRIRSWPKPATPELIAGYNRHRQAQPRA